MIDKNLKNILFKKFPDNDLEFGVYQAPGRVNIIGEHTDYNEGFVLPVAIDKRIWMAAQLRADNLLKIYSIDFDEEIYCDLNNLKKDKNHGWANYIIGVLDQFQKRGNSLQGLNIVFSGNIPLGAGLSSSAALEVVTAVMVSDLNQIKIDEVETAQLCQKAENDFVGVASGIMDQYISRLGKKDKALLIDCRTTEYRPVVFANREYRIAIVDTKVSRELVDSEYNRRCEECEKAVSFFAQKLSKKIKSLRDVKINDFRKYENEINSISEKVARRAKHVITENVRVLEAVEAIKNGDFVKLGELMNNSHQSLRDDYEVSCQELDLMVEIAQRQQGTPGSRMTGAGFGGCTVSLVHKEKTASFKKNLARLYEKETGIKPDIYFSSPTYGAGIIKGAKTIENKGENL